MKKAICSNCGHTISLDEKKYKVGQPIIITCPKCAHRFGIRIRPKEMDGRKQVGLITVIENVFHKQQDLPVYMGDNTIGKYSKGNTLVCPIMTDDPSIDLTHCVINVSRNGKGNLVFILRDGPSNTGTFVDNQILGDKEKRVIEDGTLFTIGATSVILKINTED